MEWCASLFLLLNTVKQSEQSFLASGVQRAIVPQQVNNDQDLWEKFKNFEKKFEIWRKNGNLEKFSKFVRIFEIGQNLENI